MSGAANLSNEDIMTEQITEQVPVFELGGFNNLVMRVPEAPVFNRHQRRAATAMSRKSKNANTHKH